ncbi:MAG: hypothetical protein JW894_10315 [Bacteroidales bacterium]|nr:hypothetical protein [Bacteroidales bacterium]
MKPRSYLFIIVFTVIAVITGYSQSEINLNYFESHKELGGEIKLVNSVIKEEGGITYQIFNILSYDNGNYYVNAWVMGIELDSEGSGKFLEYDYYVNEVKQEEKLVPGKSNWHNATIRDVNEKEKKSFKLKKGMNRIAFSCPSPEVPEIEFIRLSKKPSDSEIAEDNYLRFIENNRQHGTEEKGEVVDEEDIHATNINIKDGGDTEPPMDYLYVSNVNFKYTYFRYFNLDAGDYISINSVADNLHTLEIFSFINPEQHSYRVASNPDYTANLYLTVTESGYYIFKIRSNGTHYDATVDYKYRINFGRAYLVNNCQASYTAITYEHESDQTYNYFTTNLTGDSHIWIEDNAGKIRAHNDNYSGPGVFSWGLNSRVKKQFLEPIRRIQISSHLSYWPNGKCDLYIKCPNYTVPASTFPNFKADDAIRSAGQDETYNCFSWAGGVWWNRFDPYVQAYPWWDIDPLVALDNYYGNIVGDSIVLRYDTAMTYVRMENPSISLIDVWHDGSIYDHSTVTGSVNGHPHGYDWESKWSTGERFFIQDMHY